jgi:hypothetical protein
MTARTPFRRRLTTSMLVAFALAAAPAAAHAADATWHAVAPPLDDHPNALDVTFDPLGTAFVGWTDFTIGAGFATRPSAGAFGAPIAFPTSTGVRSELGFAADGEGVFVGFDRTGTIRTAVRGAGPGGAFGTVQSFGSGGFPKIAVNASGGALAAWASSNLTAVPLAVAVRQPGGGFATETLAGSPSAALVAGAAVAADGSGVVAYLDGTNVLHAVTRAAGAGGSWSGPVQLSTGSVLGGAVLAANAAGDAVVAWREVETVKAAARPHGGSFATQTVSSESGANRLAATSAAITADGTPFVTLDRFVMGRMICGGTVLQGDVAELWRRSGGTWTRVVEQDGQDGRVATSPTGDHVAFAWEGFVNPCAGGGGTPGIRVRLGAVAGTPGADALMPGQPDGQSVFANTAPSVAIDGAGNAIVTWRAIRPETGGGQKLRVAAFDTGSAPPGGGGGGGGNPPGGGGPGGGGGGGGGGSGSGGSGGGGSGSGGGGDTPPGPDWADLLGLRAPVRRIPLTLDGSLPASVIVDARCLARRGTCAVNVNPTLGGSYTPGARASAAARRGRRARAIRFSIVLPRVRATIRAGRSTRLRITIRGRALGKARTALKAGGTVKLTIVTTVNGVRAPRPIVVRLVAARRRARR